MDVCRVDAITLAYSCLAWQNISMQHEPIAIPAGMLEYCKEALAASPEHNPVKANIVQLAPAVRLLKHSTRTNFESAVYEPVLCLVLSGSKETTLGAQTFTVKTGDCLLVSHDLTVTSRIIDAPYIALLFDVNIDILRGLYEAVADTFENLQSSSLEAHESPPALVEALWRYINESKNQRDFKFFGPLILKEIHYRLLTTAFAGMLRNLVRYDSPASMIAKAISHIKQKFREPIVVAELAEEVGMSISAFHRHFKSVTKSSPLQYQKELRLLEAHRKLKLGTPSVSSVAFEVGYESPNQFSREYHRKFGRTPKADLAPPLSPGRYSTDLPKQY